MIGNSPIYSVLRAALGCLAVAFFSTTANGQDLRSLYSQIDSAYNSGDYDAVLAMEKQVSPLLRNATDTIAADIAFFLGDAFVQTGSFTRGVELLETEIRIRQTLVSNYPRAYSDACYYFVQACLKADMIAKAVTVSERLVSFDQVRFGKANEQTLYSTLLRVDVLIAADNFARAELVLQEAITNADRTNRFLGLLQGKLAYLYGTTGRYSKSNRIYPVALDHINKNFGENSDEYRLNLANYGYLLLLQGKYDYAEEHLTNAIDFYLGGSADGLDDSYYALVNNRSLASQMMGQYAVAEKGYSDIIRYDSARNDTGSSGYAVALSNAGVLYADMKDYRKAEAALKTSISVFESREMTTTLAFARTLNVLAKIYLLSGRHQDAVPLLNRSLRIFAKTPGKKSAEYATALFFLGTAHLETGSSQSYRILMEAKRRRQKLLGKKHPAYAQVLEKLAVYQWQRKNHEGAQGYFREMFDNYYGQIDAFFPVLTEEEKSNLYFNKLKPAIDTYTSWVIDTQSGNKSAIGDLYSVLTNTKGIILYATEKVRARIHSSGDSSLISLFDKWEEQKELLAYAFSRNTSQAIIDSLTLTSDRLENELVRRSSDFRRDLVHPTYSWRDVQKTLKPGEAAIEIIRYHPFNSDSARKSDKVSYAALIITRTTVAGPELVVYDRGDELEGRGLNYYRNMIQFKMEDQRSWQTYWAPIEARLAAMDAAKVFISPDGVFSLLAFNSFRNTATGEFLIQKRLITQLSSTRDLLSTRDSEPGKEFYLVGFPSFNLEPEAGAILSPASATRSVSRSVRGSLSRFLRGGAGISELPGTGEEVLKITELLKGNQTSSFTRADANEERLRAVVSPRILHIATHGYFFEDQGAGGFRLPNPLLSSGLILAGAGNFIASGINPLHTSDDGILTAYEAMNMDLTGTELVVLSACETGLGHQRSGEGVYGLQRAFFLAGAKAVIMSLWTVDDEATRDLMIHFYSRWLETGEIDTSFRDAQLKVFEKYHDPYYWAAFVITGK